MIKTIPQAIDDMAVSLGASPSAEIPTVAQALENVYTALGGTRTDLDTLVVSEVIDLVAPLIQGGGGGGGDFSTATVTIITADERRGSFTIPIAYDGDYNALNLVDNETGTFSYTVPLYKGETDVTIESETASISVSGNAEYVEADGYIAITGDCTITVS